MFPIAAVRPALAAGARYVAPSASEGIKLGVSALATYATVIGVPAAAAGVGWGAWKGIKALSAPIGRLIAKADPVMRIIDRKVDERIAALMDRGVLNSSSESAG